MERNTRLVARVSYFNGRHSKPVAWSQVPTHAVNVYVMAGILLPTWFIFEPQMRRTLIKVYTYPFVSTTPFRRTNEYHHNGVVIVMPSPLQLPCIP